MTDVHDGRHGKRYGKYPSPPRSPSPQRRRSPPKQTKKGNINDSSIGVEDFREWSYFAKKNRPIKLLGNSSAWSPGFLDKVRDQRFYDVNATLVKYRPKTKKEILEEQKMIQRRAKLQLRKWMEQDSDVPTDERRRHSKKPALYKK
jgi:hypothetical protein